MRQSLRALHSVKYTFQFAQLFVSTPIMVNLVYGKTDSGFNETADEGGLYIETET